MVGILKRGEGVGAGRRGATTGSLKRWYGSSGVITVYRALAVCIFEVGNMCMPVWVSCSPAGIEMGKMGTIVIDCCIVLYCIDHVTLKAWSLTYLTLFVH